MIRRIRRAWRSFWRRKITRDMPQIDMERIAECCKMVCFVDDFSEPSRTKFRGKYASELMYVVKEYVRKVEDWTEGGEGV